MCCASPATQHPAVHHADEDCESGAASMYWVNDSPLLAYLGCARASWLQFLSDRNGRTEISKEKFLQSWCMCE